MHPLLAQRINRHGGNDSRVNAAGKAEHHAGEAVLFHIILEAQHTGLPGFFLAFRKLGDDAWRNPPAIRTTRPFRKRDILHKHRHLHGKRSVRIQHKGSAVKHQLILPAHLIEIGHGQARFGDPRHDEVEPLIILVTLERRAIGNKQDFGPGFRQRLASLFRPDILADGNPEAHPLEGNGAGGRARLKHPLFIKHAVIGQIMLETQGLDLAAAEKRHRIIHLAAFRPGCAHENGGAAIRILGQLLKRRLAVGHETRAQHQVFRRIAADKQLRKQHKISPRRIKAGSPGLGHIGLNGTQRGVQLGQCNNESVGHARLLAD